MREPIAGTARRCSEEIVVACERRAHVRSGLVATGELVGPSTPRPVVPSLSLRAAALYAHEAARGALRGHGYVPGSLLHATA